MTFMDSLASNPKSGVYGQPSQQDDVLGIVNQLRDREMLDFKNKANFMADLSLKQDRLKRVFDTETGQNQGQGQNQLGQMNTVMGRDPNAMTGYEKGELGIRQQQLGQEQQKIAQSGKMGQEALDIKQQQEVLNKQKSDQIDAIKQSDMQRKINESNQKIQLAQQALQQKSDNAQATIDAHKALADAMEERHKLELAQKDAQFAITSKQHQDQIDALQKRIDQNANTETTTELNLDGTKKTVTTKKGSAAKKVQVTAPDGTVGYIPEDKLDEWNTQYGSQKMEQEQ